MNCKAVRNLFALILSSAVIFGAEPTPAKQHVLTITLDASSFPTMDTFGNPTVIGTQVWTLGASLTGGDQQLLQIPIESSVVGDDKPAAYIYRRGCRVGYYQVDDPKNDSMMLSFRCDPAAEQRITVTIQNAETLNWAGLFARVSYIDPRGYKSSQGIFSYQDLDWTVGVFPIASNGVFTFPIPDFGNDPVLLRTALKENPANRQPAFEILIATLRGGSVLGRLVEDSKIGNAMRVAKDYPTELRLNLLPQR